MQDPVASTSGTSGPSTPSRLNSSSSIRLVERPPMSASTAKGSPPQKKQSPRKRKATESLQSSRAASDAEVVASTSRPTADAEKLAKLRKEQKKYFFTKLEERDRAHMSSEEFAATQEARHSEASRQTSLVNLHGVKKQKARTERAEYRSDLRAAGIEARSSSPEPEPAPFPAKDAPGATAATSADKPVSKTKRRSPSEDAAAVKERKKARKRERKKAEREAAASAQQTDGQSSKGAKEIVHILDDDKEEGELGLGDLFFVDTAPAELPKELQQTKAVQKAAQQEAAAEGVQLDVGLREEGSKLPAYVDKTPPTPRSLPSQTKGKGRAEETDAMSDSQSSSAGEEPADLALNVQTTVGELPDFEIDEEAQEAEAEADMSMRTVNRYFAEERDDLRCTRCGETGHTVKTCQHIICLTCAKLDDHESRECPITLTCFRCGSRGHHIKDCPVDPARAPANRWCERCSSKLHMSINCPYIWRVYIRAPDAPSNLPAYNFNCYNCASNKHFGDDCPKPRGHPIRIIDRSAFTIDPNRRYDNRPDQVGGFADDEEDQEDPRVSRSMPRPGRPNIVNGKKMPLPPAMPRGDRNRQELRAERRDFQKEAEEARRSQAGKGGIDFGDLSRMGDREEGEQDEDDDFAQRLNGNGKGPRPGARDRRAQRDAEQERGRPNGAGYQPFKNFKEPGRRLRGDSASERGSVRSRSTSPNARDRRSRYQHQPPPAPLPERPYTSGGGSRPAAPLADRLGPNRYDSDRSNSSYGRRRSRSPPGRHAVPKSGRDNLLDRIQTARDERDYPRGRRGDNLARGDDFVSFGGGDDRQSGSRYDDRRDYQQQGNRYPPRDQGRDRQPNYGGRYRGGYT